MTVSTTTVRTQVTGDGSVTPQNTVFAFNNSSEIVVTSRVIATGIETVLVEGTHYDVAGGSWSTGTVTPKHVDYFASTVTWTIERVTPLTQSTDYVENDDFPAESHERGLDKACFQIQEREDRLGRSLHYPTTDADTLTAELPNSEDRASKSLGFDADGEPIALAGTVSGDVTVSTQGAELIDDNSFATMRATMDCQEDVVAAKGDIVVGDGSGNASRLAVGDAGQFMVSSGGTVAWTNALHAIFENYIINGGFRIDQRVGPYEATGGRNDDGEYTLDRWKLLSDGAPGADIVDVSQELTTVPGGAFAALKLTGASGAAKAGIIQIIEARNAKPITGTFCAVSFQARTTSLQIANLRAAVLSWTGAADSPTDPVSAWNGAGTDPNLAADWGYSSTRTNLALTNTYTEYAFYALTSAAATNIALFIWIDDVDMALNEEVYIGDVVLIPGFQAGTAWFPYYERPVGRELALCQRYYCKTFPYATAPAWNAGEAGSINSMSAGAGANQAITMTWHYPVTMRTIPGTVTLYNPSAAAGDEVHDTIAPAERSAVIDFKGDSSLGIFTDEITTDSARHSVHVVAEAEI